jgi:hypothetical protein
MLIFSSIITGAAAAASGLELLPPKNNGFCLTASG